MRAWMLSLYCLLCLSIPAHSATLTVQRVTDGIYAIVGPLEQRSPENLGNNATFGLVVTPQGAVLIDCGGSRKGAEALEKAVRTVTDQPIRFVINTGGQDHRWLGNSYFKEKGARIIASAAAVEDHKDRQSMQLTILTALIGEERLAGTEPVYADETFDEVLEFSFGGLTFRLIHPGQAHTPGDSFVFIPEKRTVFSGDIVYVDRLLGVVEASNSGTWIAAFKALAALKPEHLVPGHGRATDLATARAQTLDYLVHLRKAMRAHIDSGGDMIGSVEIDQSAFKHIALFDQLARRNAQAVFAEMEFE